MNDILKIQKRQVTLSGNNYTFHVIFHPLDSGRFRFWLNCPQIRYSGAWRSAKWRSTTRRAPISLREKLYGPRQVRVLTQLVCRAS